MNEPFNVLTWNVDEKVGDAGRRHEVFDILRQEVANTAGVIILTNAYNGLQEPPRETVRYICEESLNMGYNVTFAAYEDEEPSEDNPESNPRMVVLDNMHTGSSIVRLATRNAVVLTIYNQTRNINLTGVHFDDRSEKTRMQQVEAYEVFTWGSPSILAGDLSSMHDHDPKTRLIRRPIFSKILGVLPEPYASDGKKLIELADGSTLDALAELGLSDADPFFNPTFSNGKLGLAQLDHIMHSQELEVMSFRVGDKGPSNHNPISASIRLREAA